MLLRRLALGNFRNHVETAIDFDAGLTVIEGPNGHGKTNVLEAIDLLAGGRSFRRARPANLVGPVRDQAEVLAMLRLGVRETEVRLTCTPTTMRAQVNGNALRAVGELVEVCATVTFSPADLALVQGAPGERRDWLDSVAGAVSVEFRRARADLTKVLTQRARLLSQMNGRGCDADAETTLAVWDEQLARAGEFVASVRHEICRALAEPVEQHYQRISGESTAVRLHYEATWRDAGLITALAAARAADLRSGSNTVGPHRDELVLLVGEMPARTHRSQGEQRSLALALRLAECAHVRARTDVAPIVLLDDVFSELDVDRARRLIGCLPDSQTVLTTATGTLPDGVTAGKHVQIEAGAVVA